jgi:hypothetical protein
MAAAAVAAAGSGWRAGGSMLTVGIGPDGAQLALEEVLTPAQLRALERQVRYDEFLGRTD